MFKCANCQTLRALLSDREDALLERERSWKEEREALVKMIMALGRPDALRQLSKPDAPTKIASFSRPIFFSSQQESPLPSVMPLSPSNDQAEPQETS